MLPTYHHPHDEKWLNQKLSACRNNVERAKICKAYSDCYKAAYDNEPVEQKKDGKARFAANCRLRIYIAKKYRVFDR